MEKPKKPDNPYHIPCDDSVDPDLFQLPNNNNHVIPYGTSGFEKPITDKWNLVELNLPQGGLLWKVKDFSRTKDGNGDVKGSCDPNRFLRILTHDVDFPNINVKECSANVVAQNMHYQAHDDSHNVQILDAIVDRKKDSNAVDKADMHLRIKSKQQHLLHTTSGSSLLILWNIGEEEWIPLNRLKRPLPSRMWRNLGQELMLVCSPRLNHHGLGIIVRKLMLLLKPFR